jgi:hypothetical protein
MAETFCVEARLHLEAVAPIVRHAEEILAHIERRPASVLE